MIHSQGYQCSTIINTTLLPLVERCGCPCQAEIVEMPGQFIYTFMHSIRQPITAHHHATDNSRFLTRDKQDLIRNAAKTAPKNTAHELIKKAQKTPTKKIDPKLKDSVAPFIRHERAKLLTVVCDSMQLSSDIGSLKTLVDEISSKTQYGHTFTAWLLVCHNASTVSRHFALARPLSAPSDVQLPPTSTSSTYPT